ncbi:DUF3618 domain-containing protein [Streptomyces sp. AM6-12]|uniref:DUF3618 domain-containing protein n=1 Tax=Streptomyces sp. AM6-12 TaxID=3345149 RepID=UPI0037BD940E
MTHRTPHGSGAKGPDELREQIAQTRNQLGDTVAQLVGRADVKGRARARAADLKDKAGAMTVQLRSSASQAGHGAQGRAAHAAHAVKGRAAQAGHAVQGTAARTGHTLQSRAGRHDGQPLRDRALEAGHRVQDKAAVAQRQLAPPARKAAEGLRGMPRPVLMAGAAGAIALIAAGMLRRRRGC